ncbi:unnamed protein product [Pieris brassicae]|uniref:Uncharacterized protein n=1 Tax=Pieris brassicae TaxID=7116 RepID=A0A9P0TLW6_PIEBR|nr:unnamed protein product [Pieris brassicae]
MDQRRFYGRTHTIIQAFPNGSTDAKLSDDKCQMRLARRVPPITVPESEDYSFTDLWLNWLRQVQDLLKLKNRDSEMIYGQDGFRPSTNSTQVPKGQPGHDPPAQTSSILEPAKRATLNCP